MLHARAVLDLAAALDDELADRGGTGLLADVELPLIDVLARMEQVGIAVDDDLLSGLESEFDDGVRREAQEAYAVLGREINLGSPKQLQVVLFDELGMPKTKRTKTGWTTDADALQGLFEKTEHPFLAHLLRHRDVIRLRQTVEGLLKTVAEDGRIHTTFNQLIAATGRLSSTDPNLQNIPIRTEAGRRIREGFVVGKGYTELLTADYSQIEMRIMAHLSEDAALIEAFGSGRDFHSVTAARVFGVDADAVNTEMRAKIKAMNYGLAYGLSAFGLSQQLRIDTGEARGLMDEYFETFGGVRDYLHGVVDEARRTGFTETILGRRRYLPDLTSDNRQRREMAERMALNAPIQGSAADIIKVAMLGVDRALREEGLASRMLLQVHDELVFEVADERARAARGAGTPRDGLSRGPHRRPRRLRRHRPQLARRRPLSRAARLERGASSADQVEHEQHRRAGSVSTASTIRSSSSKESPARPTTATATSATQTTMTGPARLPGHQVVDQQLQQRKHRAQEGEDPEAVLDGGVLLAADEDHRQARQHGGTQRHEAAQAGDGGHAVTQRGAWLPRGRRSPSTGTRERR